MITWGDNLYYMQMVEALHKKSNRPRPRWPPLKLRHTFSKEQGSLQGLISNIQSIETVHTLNWNNSQELGSLLHIFYICLTISFRWWYRTLQCNFSPLKSLLCSFQTRPTHLGTKDQRNLSISEFPCFLFLAWVSQPTLINGWCIGCKGLLSFIGEPAVTVVDIPLWVLWESSATDLLPLPLHDFKFGQGGCQYNFCPSASLISIQC